MAMDWLGAGATLLGGLLGSDSGDKSTTQKQSMDPRMDRYVYGADGQSGLLGNAWNLYQQQAQNGGLNDLMRQGMNMQLQTLQSPQYAAGYEQMRNLGTSLLSGGIAGNPFTGGGTKSAPSTYTPFQYQGIQNASLPTYNTSPQLTSPATQAQVEGLLSQPSGSGNYSGGSLNGSTGGSTLGQGNLTDYVNDTTQATFQKYLALGFAPAVAAAMVKNLTLINNAMNQINEADDPLGALNSAQGWTTVDTSYNPWNGSSGGYRPGWGESGLGDPGHDAAGNTL